MYVYRHFSLEKQVLWCYHPNIGEKTMKRTAYQALLRWKNAPDRRPLLLQGARQVGKTWLMKEFGAHEYRHTVYVNFEKDREISNYFDRDLSPARIVKSLESIFELPINPADTLIIFDEVQESERALNSLKYFCEDAPEYHVMAAGSFLGVAVHGGFPAGKVHRLTLYPLSFYEFAEAAGKERLVHALRTLDFDALPDLADAYKTLLKTYFYVGGMPKAAAVYIEREDIAEVRKIQNDILEDYTADFSKHISPVHSPKVKMIWDSIPIHLAREKKKFVYREIKTGARAHAFEDAMNWLFDTRLVYKVSKATVPQIPLARNFDRDAFKLYMLDVGLLAASADIHIKTLLDPQYEIFSEFNGALTEQYVLQELKASLSDPVFYWGREKGMAEVDFILQHEQEIIPVEVKSGIRSKSKSLRVYMDTYGPRRAVRVSLKNYGVSGGLYSVPLYLLGSLGEILRDTPAARA
jgi:predicted AAA+ superfamily ATPase